MAVPHDFEYPFAGAGAEEAVGSIRQAIHMQSAGHGQQKNYRQHADDGQRQNMPEAVIQTGRGGADNNAHHREIRHGTAQSPLIDI